MTLAADIARADLDSLDQGANDIEGPRPGPLILKQLLQLIDLLGIEVWQVGLEIDSIIAVHRSQISVDLTLADLELPQLLADRSWITITVYDEVEAAFDPALDLLLFLDQPPICALALVAQPGKFTFELGGEFCDEILVAEDASGERRPDGWDRHPPAPTGLARVARLHYHPP